jgi:Protein  of unknown function (DUF3018)
MTAAMRMRRLRERRKAAGLKPVVAWVADNAPSALYSSHRVLDARSLAMHALIAQKIASNPQLLDIPRRNLDRWKSRWTDEPPAWFQEWQRILLQPWPTIAALLTELSENATRLRQSAPFAGVLTPMERRRVYEAFRA